MGACVRVLVLGGYGLIGSAVTRALLSKGHEVTGLGRSLAKGRIAAPQADWIAADMSRLVTPESWQPHLQNIDAVVNAAGLLQNGLRDDVTAVQSTSIKALITACETADISAFVQISAPGAEVSSDTEFFRTKADADTALKASTLRWTILRPGLVLSPHAYGGTSLVRQLAAMPMIQCVMLGKTPIQTVHVDDVASAVLLALATDLAGIDAALVEATPHTLQDIVLRVRQWLGFRPPLLTSSIPAFMGQKVGRLADLAGYLGWRSALRTTSLRVLASGIVADAQAWPGLTGQKIRTLDETLQDLPSTLQERIHARAMFWFPFLLITLSVFWIVSGLVGLVQREAATAVLEGAMPSGMARSAVWTGGLLDILIGFGFLFRPSVRWASLAAILLSLAYLAGAALFAPHLWGDPLGPMVKVLPAMALAVIVGALAEER